MRAPTTQTLAGLLALGLLAGAAQAAGGSRPKIAKDPAKRAEAALKAFDRGKERLATAQEAAAAGDEKKAKKYFKRASKDFLKATQNQPEMIEAWNQLGYTRRQQGKYRSALVAYDKALALDPAYAPAIEYRGEAYLRLGRLEDAQGAYMSLFREHRDLAAQLASSMQAWVADGGPGVEPAARDGFASWLQGREELAEQVPAEGGGEGW